MRSHTDVDDVTAWVEQAAEQLHRARPEAVRIPALPESETRVILEDPAAITLLAELAEATSAPAFYTQSFVLDEAELERPLRRLGVEEADALTPFLGHPTEAALSVIVSGVVHTVIACSTRWRQALEAAEVAALADGTYGRRWERVDETGPFRDTLEGLTDLLKSDEQFLTQATNEQLRRSHAGAVVTAAHPDHVGDLPVQVRGRIAACAAEAWAWWRTTGRPARTQALREVLPDLVGDVAGGTLEDRRTCGPASP